MTITNNQSLSRFEQPVTGGVGFLRYRIEEGTMLLLYVEVPRQSQGYGVAAELCHAALNFARERELTVVPVCSYVEAYMKRHPEYSTLLRGDLRPRT